MAGNAQDGPEWGQQPNTNMFSFFGDFDSKEPANTLDGVFFKSLGVTNVAGFAYGISPSSTDSIKDLKESLAAEGIKMGYENLSVPFGACDFTADALSMKQAGVNGATCSCVQSTNIAMAVGAKQAGVALKGALMFSGTDSSLFTNPTATTAAQGTYWPCGHRSDRPAQPGHRGLRGEPSKVRFRLQGWLPQLRAHHRLPRGGRDDRGSSPSPAKTPPASRSSPTCRRCPAGMPTDFWPPRWGGITSGPPRRPHVSTSPRSKATNCHDQQRQAVLRETHTQLRRGPITRGLSRALWRTLG